MSRRANRLSEDQLAAALAVDAAELSVVTGWAPQTHETVTTVPLTDILPSPFQPRGRPSARAVVAATDAVERAGSAAALVDDAGIAIFQQLDAEARALVELAADIAEHGVETPLEARRVPTGLELLSGHRRLAAARLAAVGSAPVIDRGPMADDAAAAIVYRRNLLRKDFTPWQEAVSFAAVQRHRRESGHPDTVRAVARALGSSHGRAGDLLGIARAFPPQLLAALGDGDADRAEEALARLSFRLLREIASEPDPARRLDAARDATGLGAGETVARAATAAWDVVERRGGGMAITLRRPPERMSVDEARDALAVFEQHAARLRARVARG